MKQLGNGLSEVGHLEEALSVNEAELAMLRRVGAPHHHILGVQHNIANTYLGLGRLEDALSLRQEVYSGRLKLNGEEDERTLIAAFNYATSFMTLGRFVEARYLLCKTMPMARRHGEEH